MTCFSTVCHTTLPSGLILKIKVPPLHPKAVAGRRLLLSLVLRAIAAFGAHPAGGDDALPVGVVDVLDAPAQ